MGISVLALVATLVGTQAAAPQTTDPSDVALHAGPVLALIADAEFGTVGALSGQDLFAAVGSREGRADFGVFLSQRLWGADDEARIYATVGTGVIRPGRLLLFGGSAGFSRALITAGVGTAVVEEGVQPAPDQVFRGSGDRTLFGDCSSVGSGESSSPCRSA